MVVDARHALIRLGGRLRELPSGRRPLAGELTLATAGAKIARVAARRLPMVVILVACVGLGAVSNGGGTEARALTGWGWVAYERTWYDQQAGQARYWISVARADGRSRRSVTPRPGPREQRDDQSPGWSVSGRLAFVRSLRNSIDLLVAEPGSWRVRRVNRLGVPPGVYAWGITAPAWSPDERRIAWPAAALFVVDVQRRTRVKVAGASCAPRWAPDGQTLLFLFGSCGEWSPEHPGVEAVRADGGARRVIARGSFNSADWSPDGLRVAYAGDCGRLPGGDPACGVLVSDADGSRLRRLRLPPGNVDWVRWTDASTIVAGGTGRRGGLLKIDVDAGTVRVLAPGVIGDWAQAPTVTADGSIAVVQLSGPRDGRPALVDVDSGAVKWGRKPIGWTTETGATAVFVD